MRPIFHAELINRPFGDPGVFIDLKFERRAILFDIGDIAADAWLQSNNGTCA
jgi:ribonuclease Z